MLVISLGLNFNSNSGTNGITVMLAKETKKRDRNPSKTRMNQQAFTRKHSAVVSKSDFIKSSFFSP